MQKFKSFSSVVCPLDRSNVDTDAIIPKQFLKSIKRSGFGVNLFDEWRYLDIGEPDSEVSGRPINTEFVLNDKRYQDAQILLTRKNFGCGSSREHAPWALADHGFKVIIAPSYADIFFNNSFKNGILPILLDESLIDDLFGLATADDALCIEVDFEQQLLLIDNAQPMPFHIDGFRKHCLMHGLDDIGLTLAHVDEIATYEAKRKQVTPWLFD